MFDGRHIKSEIKLATVDLDTAAYAEFMRELAAWAEEEAELAEYTPDYDMDEE